MISQGTDTETIAYAGRGRLAAVSAPLGKQLAVYFARAFYVGTGSPPPASDVGVMRLLSKSSCKFFSFDATDYTEASLPLAAGTVVVGDGGNGEGFVVQAKRKFGLIGLDISASDAQALTFEYYNGSTWATLPYVAELDASATGEAILAFLPPVDWEVGGDDDIDSEMYSVRVTAATAPGTAIAANAVWVASWIEYYSALSSNQSVNVRFFDDRPLILDSDEGIMPYFEEADAANGMTVAYATF